MIVLSGIFRNYRKKACCVALISFIGVLIPLAMVYSTAVTKKSRSSDLDPEKYKKCRNETDKLLSELRTEIERQMEGYVFASTTARSLNDLVPELGGQPIRSVILSRWRSGSGYLAEILNSHPGNYYHYEPLKVYGEVRISEGTNGREAVELLKSLLRCDYNGHKNYVQFARKNHQFFAEIPPLWIKLDELRFLCSMPELVGSLCRLYPFQSMELKRLKLSLVEELLADSSLNVRVVFLLRDPRGTLESHQQYKYCVASAKCTEPKRICSDLVEDYASAKNLSLKYPDRFRVLRYEDLCVAPYKTVKDLFKFIGLHYHKNIEELLDFHTNLNIRALYDTKQHTNSTPFQWKWVSSHREVRAIQRHCSQAMDLWGYVKAFDPNHQLDFYPVTDYTIT